MKFPLLYLLALLSWQPLHAQSVYSADPLVHTYSIVAYDEKTGEMGAAVQSHWFSTGTIVIWGRAGVGVVATQSFVNPAFGPQGLALMATGISPEDVVRTLIQADSNRAVRQLGVLNAQGLAAAFTGKDCIEEAGHLVGKHYAVQANLMLNDKVWPAMAQAFEQNPDLPLAERMVAALVAAEATGGDIRGSQSAALLIVGPENTGQPWVDRRIDLRVDDHENPIAELQRLLRVHRAYEHMNRGDLAMENNKIEEAMQEYSAAEAMFPDNLEMQYWRAVTLANIGKLEEALPLFARVFRQNENWRVLTPRLTRNGMLTVRAADLERILSAGR